MEINPGSSLAVQQTALSGVPTQPNAKAPATTPGSLQGKGVSSVQSQDMAQALQHLQDRVAQNSSSITLRAGLNPNGDHPGQVLVELLDKATQQVFYQYYIPADQALQAAKNADRLTPGTLLSGKA